MNVGIKGYDPSWKWNGINMFGFIVYSIYDLGYVLGDVSMVTILSKGLEIFLR